MNSDQQWNKSDFIFKRQLGVGQFGVVYQAIERNSCHPVAIKIVPKSKISSEVLYKRLKRQIEIHSRLNHQNICRLYGYFTDHSNVYMVLEYCKNGNLYLPIKQLGQHLSNKKIASITKQLLQAIAYLSNRNVMHRDIKLENILFDHDYNVKLSDFGCCVHSVNERKTVCGTIQYLCPKMISQEVYGHEVDLYCLGVVVYELFFIQSPFYDKDEQQIYKNIKEGVVIFDNRTRLLQLYYQRVNQNQRLINFFHTLSSNNKTLIIYNNKMELEEDKLNDFFNHYFGHHTSLQSQQIGSDNDFFTSWGLDLKCYKAPSMNYLKAIKDYGFLKRYESVCSAMPYVSGLRPQQVQVKMILKTIQQIYRCYKNFAKRGLWKVKQHQSYLQQFFLIYLHQLYHKEAQIRRKYSHFDKFVINVFFSLNLLKTCNNFIRSFTNFLHSSYSFSELFLYLCLKNIAVLSNNDEMIKSSILKKVIKVFQTDQSQYVSGYLSKESVQTEDDKLVSINSLFVEPLGGSLSFPKVKMYKIMKICKYTDCESVSEEIEWAEFLKQYFQIVENGETICFEHIVSSAVARATYDLSSKLLQDKQKPIRQQFLEEAFSYVFQILEAVFSEEEPQIQNQKTLENIRNLRKHFEYIRQLSEHNVAIMNKFCKKILKNSYVLELYKKYA